MKNILIIVLFIFIESCNLTQSKKEEFYDYSRVGYIYRLPIIEPYEITSPDNGLIWNIEFKSDSIPAHGVQFLKKIGIVKDMFVVYSPSDFSFSADHPQVWAVINTPSKEEKVFTEEIKYQNYLHSHGVEVIKLYDIDEVFKVFDEKRKFPLEWPIHNVP